MSRIGKLPIVVPEKVEIKVNKNIVDVKGPLGQLSQEIHPDLVVEQEGNELIVKRPSESKEHRSMHGLYRSLISNMVEGVSKGFTVEQELVGVGYKASNQGQLLELSLGYSHIILFQIPDEISVECKSERRSNFIITLKSYDKQLLGQVAAKIRSFRPPEPYKGKGIKFVGEELRKKAGKSAKV
jgi:large subunit ribosomal protein L6